MHAVCIASETNRFGEVSGGHILLYGIHCDAFATVSVIAAPACLEIRLVLETRAIYTLSSETSYLSIFDGFSVQADLTPIVRGAYRIPTLQRPPQATSASSCYQPTCSGQVRLLWIGESVCLILAYSVQTRGSFERLGLLDGRMCPNVPSVEPSNIRLV